MKTTKETLRNIMQLAWQFVKRNGYTMSEALKCAWANIKLKAGLCYSILHTKPLQTSSTKFPAKELGSATLGQFAIILN